MPFCECFLVVIDFECPCCNCVVFQRCLGEELVQRLGPCNTHVQSLVCCLRNCFCFVFVIVFCCCCHYFCSHFSMMFRNMGKGHRKLPFIRLPIGNLFCYGYWCCCCLEVLSLLLRLSLLFLYWSNPKF